MNLRSNKSIYLEFSSTMQQIDQNVEVIYLGLGYVFLAVGLGKMFISAVSPRTSSGNVDKSK